MERCFIHTPKRRHGARTLPKLLAGRPAVLPAASHGAGAPGKPRNPPTPGRMLWEKRSGAGGSNIACHPKGDKRRSANTTRAPLCVFLYALHLS